jgi:TRAP-type mannitol/chloroaromatic compound transport system permease small subunit
MAKLIRTINWMSEWSGKVTSYLVWVGALMLSWEVASRYLFNAPTIWAHGYSQRIFGTYFILIGAFTLLRGGHVRVDLLTNLFSFRVRKVLDLVNYMFLLLWGAVLITDGWTFFWGSWKLREADEMALAHPMYPIKFLLVVGAVLITLQAISFFITSVVSLVRGEEYES